MRKIVFNLIRLVDFSKIAAKDIVKYIEPYDIFDEDEYFDILKHKDDDDKIVSVASQKANKECTFGLCNFINEIRIEEAKTIEKIGNREGIVVLSRNEVVTSCVIKFKILNEGNPGNGCIGFGICDASGLNFCPFMCTRNYGPFINYYTYRKTGKLNMGSLGDQITSKDYTRAFGKHDSVNMVIDLQHNYISFGINDIMFPEKGFSRKGLNKIYIAVWLNSPGDEVQLIYEN